MPKVQAKELREKTDQELQDQMALEKKRIFDATVRGASGEAIKPHEKREARRLIACIQTILSERRLRKELAGRIAVLEPLAQGAVPRAAALAQRAPRPALGRVRLRFDAPPAPPDRAAVKLAEAKRLREALKRADAGESK